MNIAVDIDDTLTDSFDYFLPFVAEYFGAEEEELRQKNISYSNLPAEWKRREADFGKAYFDRVVADTPFKPDAAWGIGKLRALGHRIVIITGRTTDFYTDPYRTTEEKLRRGGIVYDKLICTLDKAEACRAEKISVLVDDLPANCTAALEAGISALLFDSKGNRGATDSLPRVADWSEAVEAIERMKK